MNSMRNTLLLLVGILGAFQVKAQQELMVSQYMFNGLFINPAYTGTHSFAEATALYRTQWTGFEGAPTTQTFGIDGPISNELMGIGLYSHKR